MSDSTPPHSPSPRLGLADAVSIIVGIVVGTSIFKTPSIVFSNTSGPWQALGLWLLGGALSLCGALCYAELATTYPRDGGDYEYLSRAYGRWAGFLFGWAQLAAIVSGNIGVMAYAFADYTTALSPALVPHAVWVAVCSVVGLSLLNAWGVVAGKQVQNLLSSAKVAGLLLVVAAGFLTGSKAQAAAAPFAGVTPSIGLALVFVLYAYGGWNDTAFVAAEVRDQRRSLPRALFIGIGLITAIYLAVNAAYLAVLGFEAARHSHTPASDVLQHAVGPWGSRAVSVLVMVSALGAINGMILTGSRIYATWGEDYSALRWLSRWSPHARSPVTAIVTQAWGAITLILLVGTPVGRYLCDTALIALRLNGLPWEAYPGGFETLVAASAPIFWTFFLATGVAVFVLRWKDGEVERPFRIPFFPLPPLIFCVTCGFMLYSSIRYASWLALLGAVPLAIGVPFYLIARRR